jgi:Fe(3+) dicitrate transport protein
VRWTALIFALCLAASAAAQRPAPREEKKGEPAKKKALPPDLEGLDEETLRMLEAQGSLEEVVVEAPPLDLGRVAGSASSVTEAELERFEYTDVHRVLEKVPGVYVRGEDGFGLRPNIGLRGANSDRSNKVVLMEDGVLLAPAPYAAPAAYYFPMVNRLAGLEIYKGPAAIRFGPNTVGGAVDVRTREIPTAGQSGVVDLGLGMHRYGRTHVAYGHGADRFGVLVEGIHLQSDGFKVLDGGGDTGFRRSELMLKARWGAVPTQARGQRLELKLGYAAERSQETYLGLSDPDFELTPYRRYPASALDSMRLDRTQALLAWVMKLGAPLQLRVTAYRNDMSRNWTKLNGFRQSPEDLGSMLARPEGRSRVFVAILRGDEDSDGPEQALLVGANDRSYVSQGLQGEGEWRVDGAGLSHLVRFGARAHYDHVDRRHTEDAYRMRAGSLASEGTPQALTADNRGSATAFSAHVMDELLWGRLLVVPGARVEVVRTRYDDRRRGSSEQRTQAVFLPGAAALYHLTDAFSVLGGAHRGYSPVLPGQPASGPELSVNYEAGGRYQHGGTELELIGFFNDYQNLTRECLAASGCVLEERPRQDDAGRVHVYGLEARAVVGFDAPWATRLQLRSAYTLTLSRFRTQFVSANPQFGRVEVGDALPYVPVHQASAGADVSRGRWTGAVSATFVGTLRERAGQGEIDPADRVPPRLVVDLAAGFRPTAAGEVYGAVENLFDAQDLASRRPYGARPHRPLFVQVGYRHRF